jgi:hypothetical protein
MSIVPDYIQALYAWRAWRFDGKYLSAVVHQYQRWESYPQPAECFSYQYQSGFSGVYSRHPAPEDTCTCGYYSTLNIRVMKDYARQTMVSFDVEMLSEATAIGVVSVWGKVIEHQEGYRSEYAYPKLVIVLPPTTAVLKTPDGKRFAYSEPFPDQYGYFTLVNDEKYAMPTLNVARRISEYYQVPTFLGPVSRIAPGVLSSARLSGILADIRWRHMTARPLEGTHPITPEEVRWLEKHLEITYKLPRVRT